MKNNRSTLVMILIAGLAFAGVWVWRERAPGVRPTEPRAAGAQSGEQRIAAYEAQIEALSAVDERLILYRESTPLVPDGLAVLTAIALDHDDWVYAGGGRDLVVLSPSGTEIRRLTLDGDITCLAVDEHKRLYAGLGSDVHAYDAGGRRIAEFDGLPDGAIVTALAVVGDDVFVADARSRTVLRFSTEGVLKATIDGKPEGSGEPGFIVPSPAFDLAPGQGRTLWIVNPGLQRLEEYNFDGERIAAWPRQSGMGVEDFCGCCNPAHVARLGDGSIVTSEKGIARVKIYSRRGAFIGVVAAQDQFDGSESGFDLAVDSEDRILVADPYRRQVRVFERK